MEDTHACAEGCGRLITRTQLICTPCLIKLDQGNRREDMSAWSTERVSVQALEPGDEYIVGVIGGYESREVLGVLQRTPLGGALLEVRASDGNVFRSHMSGVVNVVRGES